MNLYKNIHVHAIHVDERPGMGVDLVRIKFYKLASIHWDGKMAANPKIYIFMIKKGKISMISKCKHCNCFKGQNFPPASKVYQYLVSFCSKSLSRYLCWNQCSIFCSKQQINITQCFLGTFRNPALWYCFSLSETTLKSVLFGMHFVIHLKQSST